MVAAHDPGQTIAEDISRTFKVAALTRSAERAISFMLALMDDTLREAPCMLDDIAWVTADCSSTAAEIPTEISLIFRTVDVIVSMAATTC
jgi:hypothetical protein